VPIEPVQGLNPPVGLYSHAVPLPAGSTLLCVSGQLSVGPDGASLHAGDFDAQMEQVVENLLTVLAAAGSGPDEILKMTTYLTDADNVDDFYRVREGLFAELYPSGVFPGNTLLVVQRLVRPEFLIEIEALAAIPAPGGDL
jgi:enamine deaminase RidA (YjgF/YER057c/UK114 family)